MALEGDIPETSNTLQGNALQKAQWVWERTHTDCFADDTGLEVEALGGAPGVYSARYAGEHCSFDDNINKLLSALDGCTNRRACAAAESAPLPHFSEISSESIRLLFPIKSDRTMPSAKSRAPRTSFPRWWRQSRQP